MRAAWPGLLLATACLLPFLNKAFTIDDPVFLLEAQQILKTPLHPMSFDICWQGNETCGVAADMGPDAALMGYALIPAILGNGAEWIAHAEQLVFAWVAILAMAAIAIGMGWSRSHAMFAGLLLVAIPPFLPMASTAMPDTLSLCLTLVGIERLLAWKSERRWWQALTAGLALGIAPYGRPHLVLFLALGAVLLLDNCKISSLPDQFKEWPWRWTPIGIGLLVIATIVLLTHHGEAVLMSSGSNEGASVLRHNIFSCFLYLTIPIPLAVPWAFAHWRRAPALFLATPLAFVIGVRLLLGPTRTAPWALLASFVAAASLADLLFNAWQSREHSRVLLALWILIPLPVVFYNHFPIKYLLPICPAVVLVLFQLSRGVSPRVAIVCGALLVAAGTAYSCVILKADYRFANMSRTAARELVEPHVAAGERVWVAGQWGFYWYALRAGAQVTRPDDPGPYPGDLLAIPTGLAGSATTLYRIPNRTLVRTYADSCACGRTMTDGAGLYTNALGNLLWVWARGPLDRFELWRVY
jgi:hypothetical protein